MIDQETQLSVYRNVQRVGYTSYRKSVVAQVQHDLLTAEEGIAILAYAKRFR